MTRKSTAILKKGEPEKEEDFCKEGIVAVNKTM
jgi:hypothetical protein